MTSRPQVLRFFAVLALTFALAGAFELIAATSAYAQACDNYNTATRLGGPARFGAPFRNVTAVQKWVARKNVQKDIGIVLDKAGLAQLTPTVIDIITKAAPDQFKETEFQPGNTITWMSMRRAGKPEIIRNIRWGGKKPFKGWTFVIDDMVGTYTFILPQPCANLSLVTSEPSREKARLDAEKAEKDRLERERLAKEKAAADAARLEAERRERERLEKERLAKKAADKAKAEADRLAAEKAEQERLEAERIAAEKKAKYDVFFAGLFGKERRTRELEAVATPVAAAGTVDESLCAPLFGIKGGVEMKMGPTFKISPAVGVAFNFEEGSYSSGFAEAEFSYYTPNLKNFFGANVGIWDFTHGDYVTPSIGVQFGTQLWEGPTLNRLYFVGEGRIFTRMFGAGLENNYQFWGGLRYVIR